MKKNRDGKTVVELPKTEKVDFFDLVVSEFGFAKSAEETRVPGYQFPLEMWS